MVPESINNMNEKRASKSQIFHQHYQKEGFYECLSSQQIRQTFHNCFAGGGGGGGGGGRVVGA